MPPESPIYLHTGLSGACGSSLAGVPTCAAECRFIRVIGVLAPPRPGLVLVLCWPEQPWSAVAPASGSQRAYPRHEDRPPTAIDLVGHPSGYPLRPAVPYLGYILVADHKPRQTSPASPQTAP
jgi:hypothetical protein